MPAPTISLPTTGTDPRTATKAGLETTVNNALSDTWDEIQTKAPLSSPTFSGTVAGISKAMVGLGNVDNTSDVNKPVSTAQQTAIDLVTDELKNGLASGGSNAAGRPGDFPDAFAGALVGDWEALPAVAGSVVTDSDMGECIEIAGSGIIAGRRATPILPGRIYQARWVFKRTVDTGDPIGDAIVMGLQFLNSAQAAISSYTFVISRSVAAGLYVSAPVTCSLDAAGVDVTLPAGTRYIRHYLQTYGVSPTTRVGWVVLEDITESATSDDVIAAEAAAAAAAASEVAAAASEDSAAADRVQTGLDAAAARAAAEASGNVVFYNTFALANAAVGGLAANQVVHVFADENFGGRRTAYRKEGSLLVFKVFLTGYWIANSLNELISTVGRAAGEQVHVPSFGRTYRWVADATFAHSPLALDIIRPTAIGVGSPGRWVIFPETETSARNVSLPHIGMLLRDVTVDQDIRVALICDSLGAPHTTIPAGENLRQWWIRQGGNTEVATLETCNVISALGAASTGTAVTRSEDPTVSLTGPHFALTAGTYRFRTGGANPFATGVRFPYVRTPGGGSFTITLQAVTTLETASLVVNTDGTRSSQMATLTLPGEVTGRIPAQRMYVDIQVTSGTVLILPWIDCLDTTIDVTKLHYNINMSEGGHNFDPGLFSTHSAVLCKQIADYGPDLIIYQVYDQVEQHRGLWEVILPYLRDAGIKTDILFVSTSPVFKAGESYGDGIFLDGLEVSRREMARAYFRCITELNPECQFFDFGAIIRDADWSIDVGFTTEIDRVHPSNPAGAAYFASEFAKALGDFRASSGPVFLPTVAARDVVIGDPAGRNLVSRQTTARISHSSAGDVEFNWWRNIDFYNNNQGEQVLVARGDNNGLRVRELRFTQSTSRLTSVVNGDISVNSSKLTGLAAATAVGDAVSLSQIQGSDTASNIASSAATINTTGKFTGRLVWDTTNNRMMRAMGTNATSAWRTMDGLTVVTPS